MDYYLIKGSTLSRIADTIRDKLGRTDPITAAEFASAIAEMVGQGIPYTKVFEYTVDAVSGASYGFALNGAGYYESQNKGASSSYALCRISLTVYKECNISLAVINYAESSYDYGLFGNLDSALALSATADSSVKQSFKGMQSEDVVTLTYESVPVGSHFIDVKFIKDSSVDKNNDTVQFAITTNQMTVPEEYYPAIAEMEPNLVASNILSGVSIFGVTGTATATSSSET